MGCTSLFIVPLPSLSKRSNAFLKFWSYYSPMSNILFEIIVYIYFRSLLGLGGWLLYHWLFGLLRLLLRTYVHFVWLLLLRLGLLPLSLSLNHFLLHFPLPIFLFLLLIALFLSRILFRFHRIWFLLGHLINLRLIFLLSNDDGFDIRFLHHNVVILLNLNLFNTFACSLTIFCLEYCQFLIISFSVLRCSIQIDLFVGLAEFFPLFGYQFGQLWEVEGWIDVTLQGNL